MTDPITVLQVSGFISSDTSSVGPYPYGLNGLSGGPPGLAGIVQYRAALPTQNVSTISTLTGLEQTGVANVQLSSNSPTIAFDNNAFTTTFSLFSGGSNATVVAPVDLEIIPTLDAQVTSKSLTKGSQFSGTLNGNAYNGNYTVYTDGSGNLIPSYQFLDPSGNTIMFVRALSTIGLNVFFPYAQRFLYKSLPTGAAANMLAPNNSNNIPTAASFTAWLLASGYTLPYGTNPSSSFATGYFTQSKNGKTLSGTFVPFAIQTFTTEGSLDAYWSTH